MAEIPGLLELVQLGANGVIVILLYIGWRERQQIRDEQREIRREFWENCAAIKEKLTEMEQSRRLGN
jgi:hypothetical protein